MESRIVENISKGANRCHGLKIFKNGPESDTLDLYWVRQGIEKY